MKYILVLIIPLLFLSCSNKNTFCKKKYLKLGSINPQKEIQYTEQKTETIRVHKSILIESDTNFENSEHLLFSENLKIQLDHHSLDNEIVTFSNLPEQTLEFENKLQNSISKVNRLEQHSNEVENKSDVFFWLGLIALLLLIAALIITFLVSTPLTWFIAAVAGAFAFVVNMVAVFRGKKNNARTFASAFLSICSTICRAFAFMVAIIYSLLIYFFG